MPLEKLGRYEILGELGKGSMGVVLRAYDPAIDREVAVKTISLSADYDPEQKDRLVKRLRREAKAAGRLSHPGIVIIHDVGEALGRFFITMELIEGKTLAKALKDSEQISIERVGEIISQIADALDYAHEVGVIHRDIKPSNIMLMPDGKVKLTDFGIAKLPLTSLTGEGRVVGSPSYMAPEQVRGRKIDGRADVFSLGIITYILLTGEKPFKGDDVSEVIFKIVNEDPRPPSELNSTIPTDLDYIVSRALAKKVENRYDTAGELADAFIDTISSDGRSADTPAEISISDDPSESSEDSITDLNRREPVVLSSQGEPMVRASRASSPANPTETSAVDRIFRDMTSKLRDNAQTTSKSSRKRRK